MTTEVPANGETADRVFRAAQQIIRDWLILIGYTDEQIASEETCEYDPDNGFACQREEGSTGHPHDDTMAAAVLLMFVIDHPAARDLLAPNGRWSYGCPGADCRRHPRFEHTHRRWIGDWEEPPGGGSRG